MIATIIIVSGFHHWPEHSVFTEGMDKKEANICIIGHQYPKTHTMPANLCNMQFIQLT